MGHYTKKIVLPSGRTMEVVYFDTTKEEQDMGRLAPKDNAVSYCPNCNSQAANLPGDEFGLVDPEDPNNDLWWANIMCGECSTWRYVEAPEVEFQAWEAYVLDPGTNEIAEAWLDADREQFKAWAATFVVALKHDLLGPDDFAGK